MVQEGSDFKLLIFVGRLTHQKGSDLLAGATHSILRNNPNAQVYQQIGILQLAHVICI